MKENEMISDNEKKSAEYLRYHSPVGVLHLFATEKGLCGLMFDNARRRQTTPSVRIGGSAQSFRIVQAASDDAPEEIRRALLGNAAQQLDEYFAGARRVFDLPLDISEGTPFQRAVWNALQRIPYAKTWSYGQLASAVGNPKAARAVGGANNKNPIAIIIPCHRVIGASGKLVGFGGGLDVKQALLDLEANSLR